MLPLHEAALRKLASRYVGDPALYAREFLGVQVTPQQEEIGRRLQEPPYRALVRSAHKVGKTHYGSVLAQWHHDTFDPGLVLLTAPTDQSLRKQLFKEIRASRPFQLGLLPQANEVRHHERHSILGVVSKNPDAFQGKHSPATMIGVDEATGVSFATIDRAEGMFKEKPGFAWWMMYNPYDPTTPPYVLEQSGDWHVVHLSAYEHPNIAAALRGERPPIPAAVELDTVVKRIMKECEFCGDTRADDSCFLWPPESVRERVPDDAGPLPWGWYKPMTTEIEVQLGGMWPSSAFDAVWTAADWQRAKLIQAVDPTWAVQVGCDPNRRGADRAAFAVRKGTALVHLETMTTRGVRRPSPKIAERCRELCRRFAPAGVRPQDVPVLIDDTGGYGSGVTDYPDGYNFHGVIASEKATDETTYPSRRSELWFVLKLAAERDWFGVGNIRDGGHLVEELGLELKSARYSLDGRSRRVVEGKDSIKQRLKRSPDLADACGLAWYPVPGE